MSQLYKTSQENYHQNLRQFKGRRLPAVPLSEEELEFNEACNFVNDWQLRHRDTIIPECWHDLCDEFDMVDMAEYLDGDICPACLSNLVKHYPTHYECKKCGHCW